MRTYVIEICHVHNLESQLKEACRNAPSVKTKPPVLNKFFATPEQKTELGIVPVEQTWYILMRPNNRLNYWW